MVGCTTGTLVVYPLNAAKRNGSFIQFTGTTREGGITYCTGTFVLCAPLAASLTCMLMVVVPDVTMNEDVTFSTTLPAAPGARVIPEEGAALEVQPVGS